MIDDFISQQQVEEMYDDEIIRELNEYYDWLASQNSHISIEETTVTE